VDYVMIFFLQVKQTLCRWSIQCGYVVIIFLHKTSYVILSLVLDYTCNLGIIWFLI
jgi:hypothetical protein